jgi:hypothetical protein
MLCKTAAELIILETQRGSTTGLDGGHGLVVVVALSVAAVTTPDRVGMS